MSILTGIIFIVYLLFLSRLLLFRYPVHVSFNSINLIPFKTILIYLKGDPYLNVALRNLIGNIAIFFPFGFLAPLITDKANSYRRIILFSAVFSLLFELSQLIFRVGSFDIDDLILNTLGGFLGYVSLKLMRKILVKIHKKRKII